MTTNEILSAMNGLRFGQMTMQDRCDVIDGILKYLYSLRGYTVADNVQPEIDAAVKVLEDRISHRWPHLTAGELKLALELGVTGYFTKDKRLTIANYLDWISKYNASSERAEAVEAKMNRQKQLTFQQASRLLPAEDVARRNEEAGRNAALREYERFCQCGKLDITLQGYGAMIYDYLVRHGKLNPNEAAIREAYRRGSHASRTAERALRAQHIGEVVQALNPDKAEPSQLLDWSTKCELLTMYYSTLRARNLPLQL